MAKSPPRSQTVYFLGAGFSKGYGLPLTSELLQCLEELADRPEGKFLNEGQQLTDRLKAVFKSLYPDGVHNGFRPSVVDFFASLATYADLSRSFNSTSFPGGNPAGFLRLLKLGIARILIDRTRDEFDSALRSKELEKVVRPGVIVITSNWDPLIEAVARAKAVPLRRALSTTSKGRGSELTLLKLHGSVDWLRVADRKPKTLDDDYRPLTTLTAKTDNVGKLPIADDEIIRVSWDLSTAWQRIKARAESPHIVTMATGKIDDLGPLEQVWRDAYSALSMAKELHIVGYSMPSDDTEIRTLLRAGVQRGTKQPTVLVRNPSPDVHERVRRFVQPAVRSDFSSVVR
jgi:hypothetical protein